MSDDKVRTVSSMNSVLVRRALAAYGLTVRKMLPQQAGYRNQVWPVILADGRQVNLIIYKREPGVPQLIRNANAVSQLAAASGLPVRLAIDERILQLRAGTTDAETGDRAKPQTASAARYAALYDYLPGHTIPWEAYGRRHIVLLGAALGDLHAAMAGGSDLPLPSVARQYQATVLRMQRYFAQPEVRAAAQVKLGLAVDPNIFNKYHKMLTICKNLPMQQPLHMDFVRGNILFSGTHDRLHISGILDFEKTAMGHPMFDIARSLAFLLVDCKKPSSKVYKYFLYSGYAKRGAATLPRAIQLREQLVTVFLLYDLYKFLRHNPYESLPLNHHFKRTRALLADRRVVQ